MRVAFLEGYLIKTLPLQTEKMISNAFTNVMQSKRDQTRVAQYFQTTLKNMIEQQQEMTREQEVEIIEPFIQQD